MGHAKVEMGHMLAGPHSGNAGMGSKTDLDDGSVFSKKNNYIVNSRNMEITPEQVTQESRTRVGLILR